MSHTFNLSVSSQTYPIKCPRPDWGKNLYTNKNITLEQLIQYIIEGHTFCHNFNISKENFKVLGNVKKEKFFFSQSVFLDYDDINIDCSLYDFKESLEFKPNLLYTTPSDEDNLRCFRLVYIFEDTITSTEMYKEIVTNIHNSIKNKFNIKIDGRSFLSENQWGGNATNNIEYYSYYNNIYTTSMFINNNSLKSNPDSIYNNNTNNIPSEMDLRNNKNNTTNIIDSEIDLSNDYMNDYNSMSITDILHKYSEVYPFFESTPLTPVNEDTPYIILPNNYISIKRYWYKEKSVNNNGNEYTIHRIVKIKDGQQRRKKLFINGLLRRYMIPNITKEYMLTMLLFELYHFIDNRKDVISKKDILNICNDVMRTDIRRYKETIERYKDKRTFMSNPLYEDKYNVNGNVTKNISRSLLLEQKIGELYDCSLSVEDNLKVMKENGIKVGKNTLLKFRKKYGLDGKRINKSNKTNKEITMKEEQTNNEVKDTNKSVKTTINKQNRVKTIDNETLSVNYRIGHIIKISRINKRFKMLSAA